MSDGPAPPPRVQPKGGAPSSGPPVVVLAAGRSTRMGSPKALLRVGGITFLQRILTTCAECGLRAVVVRRCDQRDLEMELERLQATGLCAGSAFNPDPKSEMLDSFRAGLEALCRSSSIMPHPGGTWASGAFVWPVDVPAARPQTVSALTAAALRNPHWVVFPRHRGRPGHPACMPPAVLEAVLARLPSERASEGLRTIAADCGVEELGLDVDDPAVVLNVNTPADLERLERLSRSHPPMAGRHRDKESRKA